MTSEEKEDIRELIENHKIYKEPRYRKWRSRVFKRDGHSCQYPNCKWPQGKLNAHHIHMKWYHPEWIFKLTNGITLCEYHHTYIHKKGSSNYIEAFTAIAELNTEHPKVSKRAKKLNRRSVKSQLKNAKKKRTKKRIIRTIKSKGQLVRRLK